MYYSHFCFLICLVLHFLFSLVFHYYFSFLELIRGFLQSKLVVSEETGEAAHWLPLNTVLPAGRVAAVPFFGCCSFYDFKLFHHQGSGWRWLGLPPTYYLTTFPLMETTIFVPVFKNLFPLAIQLVKFFLDISKSFLDLNVTVRIFSFCMFSKSFALETRKGNCGWLATCQRENCGNTFNMLHKAKGVM